MATSEELVEKLGRLPLAAKAGLAGGLLAVLLGGYAVTMYADLAAERRKLTTQAKKLGAEEAKLQDRRKQYVELLEQKRELEEELRQNAVRLPASSELPAFFVHLQAQALAANVHVVKWSRDAEIPVESYVKVPVKMEVAGDFYQLSQYFKLLYETPRIITVENLNIEQTKRAPDRTVLSAAFTASTFRQADRPPDTHPDAPGAPTAKPHGAAKSP